MTNQAAIYIAAAARCKMPVATCKTIGKGVGELIVRAVSNGGEVSCPPIGVFYLLEKSARTGHVGNPPRPIQIPAKRKPALLRALALRKITATGELVIGSARGRGASLVDLLADLLATQNLTRLTPPILQLRSMVASLGPNGVLRVWDAVCRDWVKAAFFAGKSELQPLGVIYYLPNAKKSVMVNPQLSYDRKIVVFKRFGFRPTRYFQALAD